MELIIVGIIINVATQFLKIVFNYFETKKWDWKIFISSGGNPSAHTTLIVGVTAYVGFVYGFDSLLFGFGAVMSAIVYFDSCNVRNQVGLQAQKINELTFLIDPENHSSLLKEKNGHSHSETFIGAIVGIALGLILAIVKSFI